VWIYQSKTGNRSNVSQQDINNLNQSIAQAKEIAGVNEPAQVPTNIQSVPSQTVVPDEVSVIRPSSSKYNDSIEDYYQPLYQ